MTTYLHRQIATARIDDLQAQAETRRLARACRNPRGRFSLRTRTETSVQGPSGNAEWWGAAATATGRGLPA